MAKPASLITSIASAKNIASQAKFKRLAIIQIISLRNLSFSMLRLLKLTLALIPVWILIWPFKTLSNETPLVIYNYSKVSVADFYNKTASSRSSELLNLVLNAYDGTIDYLFESDTRTRNLMRNGAVACVSDYIKNSEREKEFLFTKPITLYLGQQLYYNKESITIPDKILNNKGQIKSLPALFEHFTDKHLYVGSTDSYGEFLDQQIKQLNPENKYIQPMTVEHFETKFRMFNNGRVTFILAYPSEIHELFPNEDFMPSYSIAGNEDFIVGRIMCSKNEGGRQAIKKLNAAINSLYHSDAHISGHLDWAPKSHHNTLLSAYSKAFVADN